MTRNWLYTEKIVALLLLILGGVILFSFIFTTKSLIDYLNTSINHSGFSLSIPKLIWREHILIILSLLSVFSGATLMLSKKIGWVTAISVLTYYSFMFCLNLIVTDKTENTFDQTVKFFIWNVLLIAISISILIVLLLRPYRSKYAPTKINWLTIILIVGLLFTDVLIAHNKQIGKNQILRTNNN